jgi:ABC-type sugar transport system ATPase subunit
MCDRTYVMHEGRLVGEVDRADASEDALVSHFFGSPHAQTTDGHPDVSAFGRTIP